VREAAPLRRQDPVIRIGSGKLRRTDPERRPLLHILEDEVHPEPLLLLRLLQPGPDVVFLPHAFLSPFHRDLVVAGVGFDPPLVVARTLAQQLFGHHRFAHHVPETFHHLIGPRQSAQISVDHNPVEAVVYKYKQGQTAL